MSFDAVSFETVESVEGCCTYRALEHRIQMNRSQVSLERTDTLEFLIAQDADTVKVMIPVELMRGKQHCGLKIFSAFGTPGSSVDSLWIRAKLKVNT